jgi:hypothetical protein
MCYGRKEFDHQNITFNLGGRWVDLTPPGWPKNDRLLEKSPQL